MNKLICAEGQKNISLEERSVTHFISKSNIDRGGDIVLPDSIDDKSYQKNPIVLFNHWHDSPVGKSLWRKTEDDGVLAKTQFATTPLADDVFQLNKEGVLNAWSIGFSVNKDGFEYDDKTGITTYTDIELLEYSSVTVPMNQDAITEGLKIIKSQEITDIFKAEKFYIDNKQELIAINEKIDNIIKNEIGEIKARMDELKDYNIEGLLKDLDQMEKEILKLKQAGTLDARGVFDEILQKR